MTAPVTGPFVATAFSYGPYTPTGYRPVWMRLSRTSYRQKPPYNLPLEFAYAERRVLSYNYALRAGCPIGSDNSYATADDLPGSVPEVQANYNRAYARFKEKLGESVDLGVALAEGKQSMNMMTKRLMQMARFTRQVARGRLGDAAKTLGLRKLPPGMRPRVPPKEAKRRFADNYLEFHFGWSPLVGDIYGAAEVLSNPFKPHPIRARSVMTVYNPTTVPFTVVSDTTSIYHTKTVNERMDQTIVLRGDLVVTNPNLALANQVGLTNPLTIAWELVPFSFVLDWFVNVGDFLSSFTDFAGVELLHPHRTVFSRLSTTTYEDQDVNRKSVIGPVTNQYGQTFCLSAYRRITRIERMYAGTYCRRIVGPLPGPTLAVRAPWTLSPRRGLAAISLLIQGTPQRAVESSLPVIGRKRTSFRRGAFPEAYWNF